MRETLAIENQPNYWSERQVSSPAPQTLGPGSDNGVQLQHPALLPSASSSVRAEQRLRGVGGAERRRRGARRAVNRCSAPSLPTLRGAGFPGGEQPRAKGSRAGKATFPGVPCGSIVVLRSSDANNQPPPPLPGRVKSRSQPDRCAGYACMCV